MGSYLETAIANFEAASTGSDVKESLIDLLDSLNTLGGNVTHLGGVHFSGYVTKKTMNYYLDLYKSYIKFATKPAEDKPDQSIVKANVPAVIRNRDLYEYFNKLFLSLRKIDADSNGKYHTPSSPDQNITNIEEAIRYMYAAFWNGAESIKEAIQGQSSRGGVVEDTDNILELAGRISKIRTGELLVEPLTVNELKCTKEAPEGHAYNPVTIDVNGGAVYRKFTEEGTFSAQPGTTGYSSIEVDVPFSGSGGSGSGSGGSSGSGSNKDDKTEADLKIVDITFTENGEYDAGNSEADGYGTVTVAVTNFKIDPDARFKVKFIIGDHTETVEDVEPYSNVEYPGEIPEHEDTGDCWYFKGWNPEPYQVIHDMVCYGEYGIVQPGSVVASGKDAASSISVGFEWSSQSWDEICANGGSSMNIGSMKPLFIDGFNPIIMQKVTASENGATSVFVARSAVNSEAFGPNTMTKQDPNQPFSWKNSKLRYLLNSTFYDKLPNVLKSSIKTMTKGVLLPRDAGVYYDTTEDNIWIPGIHEANLIDYGVELPLANGTSFKYEQAIGGASQNAYNSVFPWFTAPDYYPVFKPGQSQKPGLIKRLNEIKVSGATLTQKYQTLIAHVNDMRYQAGEDEHHQPIYSTRWDDLSAAEKISITNTYGYSNVPHYDMNGFFYKHIYKTSEGKVEAQASQVPIFYKANEAYPMADFGSVWYEEIVLRDSGGRSGSVNSETLFLLNSMGAIINSSTKPYDYMGESPTGSWMVNPGVLVSFGIGRTRST